MALSWCQMPNGYTFALENQKSIYASGDNIILDGVDGRTFTWEAYDLEYANNLFSAIQVVMVTPANFTAIAGAPVFSSVSPSSFHITPPAGSLIGFGFTAAINSIKIGSGTPYTGDVCVPTFISSTRLDYAMSNALVAGVYPVYYSTDGGSTYTDTGLTVTCTT